MKANLIFENNKSHKVKARQTTVVCGEKSVSLSARQQGSGSLVACYSPSVAHLVSMEQISF